MVPAAGGELRPGPKGPPGAGRDWKAAPSSVVTTMAGQSRDPQGTRPSTHQRVALTAVNDSGTNPGRTTGRAVTAGREGDGVAGSRADAGPGEPGAACE